jgi:ribosome-associated protein
MWQEAVRAAEEKQVQNVRVLDLRDVTTFADYFVILTGTNTRQIQAIADEIHQHLKKLGEMPNSMEGYDNAEWVLMDYGDYLIHIFSEKARLYYDLERLWRDAKTVELESAT